MIGGDAIQYRGRRRCWRAGAGERIVKSIRSSGRSRSCAVEQLVCIYREGEPGDRCRRGTGHDEQALMMSVWCVRRVSPACGVV